MKFPYRPYRVRLTKDEPLATVWRPVVPIALRGPLGEVKLNALIDCGADQTMMPRLFADALGIKVNQNRPGRIRGVGAAEIEVHPGTAEIEIRQGRETFRWEVDIQFGPSNHILLGQLGALEWFLIELDYHRHEFSLEPTLF